MSSHHPPHLHLDAMWYMVTAATYHRAPLLASDRAKQRLCDAIRTLSQAHAMSLRAWVILDDHYHLLLHLRQGNDLPRFIARLHGGTARLMNLDDETPGRKVWQNYWDSCIRAEADLWTRFNYIHLNPLKHGYVQRPEDWSFSSYQYYHRTKGEEWLNDCLLRYPVTDVLEGDISGDSPSDRGRVNATG